MQEPEILKYKTGNGEIEIRLTEEGECYLSQSAMARLFSRSVDAVSLHLRKLAESGTLDLSVVEESSVTGADGKRYKTKLYPLSAVLEIGRKIRSDEGEKLKEFVESRLAERERKSGESIIIYNNGGISLPVTVSPEQDTVWLTQNQIAELFGTTVQNVSAHIQNIREDGELDCTQFFKKSLNNPLEKGSGRRVERYNLDVILAVGYRVKSGRAVRFRRWASGILKEYMRKGHAVDGQRLLAHDSNLEDLNRTVISLIAKREEDKIEFDRIRGDVNYLLKKDEAKIDQLFHAGELLEARIHVKALVEQAKQSVVLVDPYASLQALDFLKGKRKGVRLTVYYSSPNQLTDDDIDSFNKEYGGLSAVLRKDFHDRYLIIDQKEAFFIGASLNQLGQKMTLACQIHTQAIVDYLVEEFPLA